MAEDNQWPSEDEDFDAVTTTASSKSKPVSVAVSQPEAPETEAEVVEPEAETQSEPEAADPVDPGEPESEPESPAEPEAAPAPQPVAASAPPKVSKASKQRLPKFGARTVVEALLVIAVIGLGLWAWNLSSDNKNLKQQVSQLNANPQSAVEKQTQALINQVGTLISLPTGETPTVANVTDAAQAKQQSAFFNNAQNGDKVLMYVKAGEAILYRPSTNKIILVAPLTLNNTASTTTTPTTTSNSTTKK